MIITFVYLLQNINHLKREWMKLVINTKKKDGIAEQNSNPSQDFILMHSERV